MKRWIRILLFTAVVFIAVTAVWFVRDKRLQRHREDEYRASLTKYSAEFVTGMTRKDVEAQLRSKGIRFQQLCCLDEKSAYADLIRIGKERAPWFCSEHNVYVALQFAATELHNSWVAFPTDKLARVTLSKRLEGCL